MSAIVDRETHSTSFKETSMTAYLVRLKKNAELVGLFVSPSDDMLWDFVDECCDPYECEFVRLPAGGVYLSEAGAPAVPTSIEFPVDDRDIPDWFAGATLSELWLDVFYSKECGPYWQAIEASN
jgi:hypothetical protein